MFRWWKLANMARRTGLTIFPSRRRIVPTSIARFYHAVATELPGPCRRRNRRLSPVPRRTLIWVGVGLLHMLGLSGHRSNVSLMRRGLLGWRRTRTNPTVTAVVAHMIDRCMTDRCVVNVMNISDIHVEHSAIVKKVPIVPTTAFESNSEIAETIIDSAIEANRRPPIAVIEDKAVTTPTPIPRRPEKTDLGSQHPSPRHPIVVIEIVTPSPVTGRPEITIARTNWLFINRQRRRSDCDYNPDSRKRCSRHAQHDKCEQQRTDETDLHCISSAQHPSFSRYCSPAAGCVD